MNSRRNFIKSASAIAALPLTTQFALDAVDERKGVELAIATICLDGFGDEHFEPSFRLIPQTGIKHVEFNVWYPRNMTPAGIEHIRSRCYETGLKPISLQGTSFGGRAVRDVAQKLWLMEQARSLGCRRVKFTGAGRGNDGGLDQVIEVLKELAPAAKEMGVLVLVENHANNNIETIEDYDRIFEAIPEPNVGMCLDMGHFDGASVSCFDVIERFHERVLHIDLKDTIAFGTYKTVNFGEGITDVHGVVEAALEKGFTGYLVIEQAPPLNPETLLADMQRAYTLFSPYVK